MEHQQQQHTLATSTTKDGRTNCLDLKIPKAQKSVILKTILLFLLFLNIARADDIHLTYAQEESGNNEVGFGGDTMEEAKEKDDFCPSRCSCKKALQTTLVKLKCGGSTDPIASLDEVDLLNITSEIVQFNLSSNHITAFHPRVQMIALQRLDLSRNGLLDLHDYQFIELPNLRRLDLSNNLIQTIASKTFAKLDQLERLKLSHNKLKTIQGGTFEVLSNLRQLDISNNPLACDCHLLSLVEHSGVRSIKLLGNPRCYATGFLVSFRKLRHKLDCNYNINLEIRPVADQVVFGGDSMTLDCTIPLVTSATALTWQFNNRTSLNVTSERDHSHLVSKLTLAPLTRNHTGHYSCHYGNITSKSLSLLVITNETRFCPVTTTTNNKGSYTWPMTVANRTTHLMCASVNLNYEPSNQRVTYRCDASGTWRDLNATECFYVSENTKILEQFSKVNSSISESVRHFRNYTSNEEHFRDTVDFEFAVMTMENYLKFARDGVQVAAILMDVADTLIDVLPKSYLRRCNGSVARLVNVTEQLAQLGNAASLQLHRSHVASQIFDIDITSKNRFRGLKCTWYLQDNNNRLFYCMTGDVASDSNLSFKDKMAEASITIPDSIVEISDRAAILVTMFASNKLFPVLNSDTVDVLTSVVGAKLVGHFVEHNLTDPLVVTLTCQGDAASAVPVRWDDATREWTQDGCFVGNQDGAPTVTFYCHNFGYFGLLEKVPEPQVMPRSFKLCHPAIYVGSLILMVSLIVSILTYLLFYDKIQMARSARHSLVNLWIAICFLIFMHAFGVYQTQDARTCQIVGLSLHYFTLSPLLWICVGVNCLYKRVARATRKNKMAAARNKDLITSSIQDDDDEDGGPPVKKPIVGLYFVGWGVAIIVCGISAAINVRDYSSPDFCFLRSGPSLAALYIPVAVLVIFILVFSLLIRCVILNYNDIGQQSEGTQATENVDLDLLDDSVANNQNGGTSRSVATSSTTCNGGDVDLEHAPSAQIKAYLIFTSFYATAWLSGALSTAYSDRHVGYHYSDMFGVAYAIASSILGAFTLFFYCVRRVDVREQWRPFLLSTRRSKWLRPRSISDNNRPVATPLAALPPSRASSSAASGAAGPGPGKIVRVNNDFGQRNSGVPNIIENPATNIAEIFYNPHQSTVARKFFRRQQKRRHHTMAAPSDAKNNLVVVHRRHLDSCSSGDRASGLRLKQLNRDASDDIDQLFGTSSKVNNANIHHQFQDGGHDGKHYNKRHYRSVSGGAAVPPPHKKHNLNLLSQNDTVCQNEVDADSIKVVLSAERMRRGAKSRKQHNRSKPQQDGGEAAEAQTRSVSQQCTLDYCSSTNEGAASDLTVDDVKPIALTDGRAGRSSSISCVSDLDELYQQIRGGATRYHDRGRHKRRLSLVSSSTGATNNRYTLIRGSPCFSDSDINVNMATDCDKMALRRVREPCRNDSNASDVETTV